jgi:hypothetical protein
MSSGSNPAALRRARAAILAAAVMAAAGCAGLQSLLTGTASAPFAEATFSNPAASPPMSLETPVAASRRRRRHHAAVSAKTLASAPTPAPVSAITPAASPASSPTPAVTLAGVPGIAGSTQNIIDSTAARLNGIDRAKLAAPDAAAYDQARGLLAAALTAKGQGDDLAAAGLARKASALAGRLPVSP